MRAVVILRVVVTRFIAEDTRHVGASPGFNLWNERVVARKKKNCSYVLRCAYRAFALVRDALWCAVLCEVCCVFGFCVVKILFLDVREVVAELTGVPALLFGLAVVAHVNSSACIVFLKIPQLQSADHSYTGWHSGNEVWKTSVQRRTTCRTSFVVRPKRSGTDPLMLSLLRCENSVKATEDSLEYEGQLWSGESSSGTSQWKRNKVPSTSGNQEQVADFMMVLDDSLMLQMMLKLPERQQLSQD
ncbi:hypothetical protein Tco_0231961 [Tanacetum coccineum]